MINAKKLILTAFLFLNASFAMASSNPYVIMEQVAEKTFNRIKNEQSLIKSNPNELKKIVRQELLPYVQTKYAGALILGTEYQKASTTQKNAYFKAFEDYIVQAYAQALTVYNGQTYEIEKAKNIGNKDSLSIRILVNNGNNAPIRLDFLWRKNQKTGDWKAYDMVAEGLSMITTKQNEWSNLLRQKGIDTLTEYLKKQAASPIKLN